jgi:hypothetical protein
MLVSLSPVIPDAVHHFVLRCAREKTNLRAYRRNIA